MGEDGRQVPIQTLQDAIRYGEVMPAPRGLNIAMYTVMLFRLIYRCFLLLIVQKCIIKSRIV